MRAVKVTTDGVATIIDLAEPIYRSLGAELGGFFEIVRPRSPEWPQGLVMVVDEDGLNKRLPHNCVGTHFYDPHMKHSVGIVGDIIIMCEGMTDEGPDFVDMPQDMAKETLEIMTVMYIAERYKDEVLVFHKPDGWKFATKNQELGAKIVKMIEAIKTPDETVTHETVKGSRVMTELLEAKESARRVSKSLN